MDIQEATDAMGLNLPKAEYDTIAGFVLSNLGKIPETGEQFQYENLLFKIDKMDNFRIDSILIRKKLITPPEIEPETQS